jgi:hypothetical protein
MQLSLGDCCSLATRFAGRSDFSTSEVSQLANVALGEISTRVHHVLKEANALSNVTGTGTERRISLPGDFDYPFGLVFYSTSTDDDGNNQLDTKYDLPIVDTTLIDSKSSTSGIPERYALYGDYLEVDPIPDSRGSFILRYAAKQPPLVLSTSTPGLDERWHMGWVWKTTELVHLARGNAMGANEAQGRYVNYMVTTPSDRQREQSAKNGMGLRIRRS